MGARNSIFRRRRHGPGGGGSCARSVPCNSVATSSPGHPLFPLGRVEISFILAVRNRQYDEAKTLLRTGSVRDLIRAHCILCICQRNDADIELVHILVEESADKQYLSSNLRVFEAFGPFWIAIYNSNWQIAKYFFEAPYFNGNCDLNTEDVDGWTCVFYAVKLNDTDFIHYLVGRGADVNHRSSCGGKTVLHIASLAGNVEAMQLLLELGVDMNACDAHGNTPLMDSLNLSLKQYFSHIILYEGNLRRNLQSAATFRSKLPGTRLLIQCGADLHACNHEGATALYAAVSNLQRFYRQGEVATELLDICTMMLASDGVHPDMPIYGKYSLRDLISNTGLSCLYPEPLVSSLSHIIHTMSPLPLQCITTQTIISAQLDYKELPPTLCRNIQLHQAKPVARCRCIHGSAVHI